MKKGFIYKRIAEILEHQILGNTLQAGDKLPSLRTICREYGVSQNTALKAYYLLESKMLIETRPQSGYYVRYSNKHLPGKPSVSQPLDVASFTGQEEIVATVYEHLGEESKHPFALAEPSLALLPVAKLNKALVLATRSLHGSGVAYDKMEGNERLRRQIARWSYAMECSLSHEDIITTSGCLNAVSYCLMSVTKKGDTVAMESPVSFGMLQIASALGLKILELPTDPDFGVDINALEKALKKGAVNACLLISNFSNPLGSYMPDEHKKDIVKLIQRYNIPLIENDINGDVYFGTSRPKSCKTFDDSGLVLWCGSVSKTLAPGYRVGWVAAGRFKEAVQRNKLYHTISTTSITQEVIAHFLETGRYENHLKKLRQTLHTNLLKYTAAIMEYFPTGTRISNPKGGFVIWLELPPNIDTRIILKRSLPLGINFAPGNIFTLQSQFHNCLRLNLALPWNESIEGNLRLLGSLFNDYIKKVALSP